jgi:hypothetical protein
MIDSTRSYEEVLSDSALVFSKATNIFTAGRNHFEKVNAHFESGKKFVWQVKAYTNDQEIAKSEIYSFGGPPCILDFIAADEYITVTFTDGCDLSNLSGTGTVKLFPDAEPMPVSFNNIKIAKEGVQYYLQEGTIWGDLSDSDPFILNPKLERNAKAQFQFDSIRITRHDLNLKGMMAWNFPHAADQDDVPMIESKPVWLIYEDARFFGDLPFKDSTAFDLLDPMNFHIDFIKGSKFTIYGDKSYDINFNGVVTLPLSVKDLEGDTVFIPFTNHKQVYNITANSETNYTPILVANRTTLTIAPINFNLDLDDLNSFGYFEDKPGWRGLIIQEGQYSFNGDMQFSKQFGCNTPNTKVHNFNTLTTEYAYIINDGLYMHSDISFEDNKNLFFNTFPAKMHNFHIDVAHSYTNEGQVTGGISIPLLDDTDDFPFTCNLNQFGFQTGFLNESLDDQTFVYNEDGGEQKLLLTFNRGYFADNERLETTITIEWPYFDLSFEQLPGFRIWGNYDIGFGIPSGAYTLARQMQTRMKGFEITIDGIGAGRQGNLYAIGTTAKIVMGEDVSGDGGPPVVNLYSIFESSKIDEKYVLGNSPDYSNQDFTSKSGGVSVDPNIGQATQDAAVVGDVEAMVANYESKYADTESSIKSLKPTIPAGAKPPSDDLQGDFANLIPATEASEFANDPVSGLTLQELIQLIDFFAPMLEPDKQAKLLEFKEMLTMFSMEEIASMMDQFSDIRGLLNKAIQAFIDSQLAKVTDPLKQKVDVVNGKIETGVMNGADTLLSVMGKGIDIFINGAAEGAIALVNAAPLEDASGVIDGINQLSASSRVAIKTELNRTVEASVHKNIVLAATGIVDTVLYTGTVLYLSNQLSANAANLITNKDFDFKDVNIDFDGMVDSLSGYLSDRLTFDYFKDRINATINDAYNNFNWDSVAALFLRDFGSSIVGQVISDKVNEAVTNAIGDVGKDMLGGLAGAVEMDFSNLGDKLKSGDVSGIIKLDPSKIVLVTPVVDLSGYVEFYEDDPVWGDAWKARLNAKIKAPTKFGAYAEYVNGSKHVVDVTGMTEEEKRNIETFKYWFLELGVTDISVQMGPLPLLLTGANGKIYHHMVRQPDMVTYLPHDSIRFGLGLRAYMVDQGGGAIADFNLGLELEIMKGGFLIEMNGQAMIANLMDKDGKIKKNLIYSEGFIRYNSVEKHLLGSLTAEAQTQPLLCAGGGMVIDISKDWWQFAIGTREQPVYIALLCRDTIFRGWFDINKAGLDLGLFANIRFDLQSPWIKLGVVKFRGWAYFFFDFESELVIFWSPKFGVQKARVFIDIGAGVGIDWKTLGKSGSFTIAAVNLGGGLEFATMPEAYLRGEVHGSITILNITAGLKLEANINF